MIKILIVLLIAIFFQIIFFNIEKFTYRDTGPTKCFSCGKHLPKEFKYLANPTKCFDCEKELIQRYNSDYAKFGQPTKCFSC